MEKQEKRRSTNTHKNTTRGKLYYDSGKKAKKPCAGMCES
jgi:hypothetical protein